MSKYRSSRENAITDSRTAKSPMIDLTYEPTNNITAYTLCALTCRLHDRRHSTLKYVPVIPKDYFWGHGPKHGRWLGSPKVGLGWVESDTKFA